MKKKILAVLMAAALSIGMLPTSVLADTPEDTAAPLSEVVDEQGDQDSADSSTEDDAISDEVGTYDEAGGSDAEYVESSGEYSEYIEDESVGEDEISDEENAIDDDELSDEEEELDEGDIMLLAVSGDAGISSFSVSAQVDGTEPFDSNDAAGNDSNASNNIIRTFDYVDYTLSYTTALSDASVSVNSGIIYVEFELPCGPDTASFNMDTINWMTDPVVTYYLPDGTATTTYTNGMEVSRQVLTGYRTLTNTGGNTVIPGTGTLSIGIYIGAAQNGQTLQPSFTVWMDGNSDEDKVIAENVNALTISAAQKYNIAFRQSSEMNIYGRYDLSTGNSDASTDPVSGNTTLRGRMESYGITVMMQNDSVEKGLKGLEFPTGDITFDLTLSEQATNSSGQNMSNTAGYTPVVWDYDANLRQYDTGKWGRSWVYTSSYNNDCAYQGAPFNKLGCHDYSTIYDSCYDGGGWTMVQDSDNPLVYHVTISDYTFDYENYNFPSDRNTWYKRTEPGTAYSANQACFSSGVIQMVLQFPEQEASDAPTHIYYKMTADNFAVGDTGFNVTASYSNTYELLAEGSINSGVNFCNSTSTSRSVNPLGSSYTSGDAYSYTGSNVRLFGANATTSDETVRTKATLIKFDADAFEINRSDAYYANGRVVRNAGVCTVNSWVRYFAGRSENWGSEKEMSDTLINSEDLHYYSSLDELEQAGYVCVGVLYISDVECYGSN